MIKFTIFTPTYNRKNYLERCYRSIVSQNFESLEWLVIDDGSNDGTKELIYKFISEKKIDILYIYQENAGKQAAWNLALEKARGQYFIGLDSDDALNEDCLDAVINDVDIISSNESVIGLRCLSKKFPVHMIAIIIFHQILTEYVHGSRSLLVVYIKSELTFLKHQC